MNKNVMWVFVGCLLFGEVQVKTADLDKTVSKILHLSSVVFVVGALFKAYESRKNISAFFKDFVFNKCRSYLPKNVQKSLNQNDALQLGLMLKALVEMQRPELAKNPWNVKVLCPLKID